MNINTLKITSIVFLILTLNACSASKPKIQMADYRVSYELSMPEPTSHYFEVKMEAMVPQGHNFMEFKMAAWTPGSYLIREYAKNVEGFKAFAAEQKLQVEKTSKNTWKVKTNGNQKISISYKVYAYELTVRTAHLDDSHGYVNGAAIFMFVPELMKERALIKVIPHESFKTVSVALPEIAKNTFEASDFDLIVDSPIEIGNQEILTFESMGVKHTIANYSVEKLIYDKKKVLEDYKKIVEASATVFGGPHPCKEYLFIIHHLPGIGGGLEHLNSTTCQTSPDVYGNSDKYVGFLGLLAHEYFHLWNVKRLRPIALGPFDYENENYTNMLWVSEGFTSFYQDDILRRAGIIDESKFLSMQASKIGTIENAPGNKAQSVAEASWDAWIKFYRPNENSNNSTISYYTKGGVIANILNLIIIGNTNGQKSLDDALRLLYKNTYLKSDIGFTDNEFKLACEEVSGKNLDDFFEKCIFGTDPIDYKGYFDLADIDARLEPATNLPYFGANVRGKTITRVDKGTAAFIFGLNVNDEIEKVNGKTFSNINDIIENKKVGDVLEVEVFRGGIKRKFDLKLLPNPNVRVLLVPKSSSDQNLRQKYNKFVHLRK